MTQLYAMTAQMTELAAMLDTDDEGLKEAIQDTMSGIQGEFEIKADNIVMLRRNIEGDILAIDSEIDRLTELKRIKNNSIDQLGEYLRKNMEAAEIKSIKRPLFTITLAIGSERVVVDKEDDIPDDFTVVKTSISPDKKAIASRLKEIRTHNDEVKAKIEAGDYADVDALADLIPEPSWAHLERGESSIRIK